MADKRISELPNLASIQDDAMFVVEYNGVAYHLTGKQFKAFAESLGGGSNGETGDMDASTYDPAGAVAQAGGIEAYVSELVGDIDTVLDSVNGEMTSALDSALDEINGEVV